MTTPEPVSPAPGSTSKTGHVVIAPAAIREAVDRTKITLLAASSSTVASLDGGHRIPVDHLWYLVDTATALLEHDCPEPAVSPAPDTEALRQQVAQRLSDLDARDWGGDHGFVPSYGSDTESDAFVDAVVSLISERDPAPAAAEVQWGVQRADGVLDQMDDEDDARLHLRWFDPGTAHVVSRTVVYGPWTSSPATPQAPAEPTGTCPHCHCALPIHKTWCTEIDGAATPGCPCFACAPAGGMRVMNLCPTCGNKRCPGAANHRNTCTGSNEPGQPGSLYANVVSPADLAGLAAREDAATPDVHQVEVRESKRFPGLWSATCWTPGCDQADSGTEQEANDWADLHRADTIRPSGPLAPIRHEEE